MRMKFILSDSETSEKAVDARATRKHPRQITVFGNPKQVQWLYLLHIISSNPQDTRHERDGGRKKETNWWDPLIIGRKEEDGIRSLPTFTYHTCRTSWTSI